MKKGSLFILLLLLLFLSSCSNESIRVQRGSAGELIALLPVNFVVIDPGEIFLGMGWEISYYTLNDYTFGKDIEETPLENVGYEIKMAKSPDGGEIGRHNSIIIKGIWGDQWLERDDSARDSEFELIETDSFLIQGVEIPFSLYQRKKRDMPEIPAVEMFYAYVALNDVRYSVQIDIHAGYIKEECIAYASDILKSVLYPK